MPRRMRPASSELKFVVAAVQAVAMPHKQTLMASHLAAGTFCIMYTGFRSVLYGNVVLQHTIWYLDDDEGHKKGGGNIGEVVSFELKVFL